MPVSGQISFEEWLVLVLDHSPSGPEWFWEPGFGEFWKSLQVTDELTVGYITRLFSEVEKLEPYSLEQVAQAIWFLIGDASPAQPSLALLNPSISLQARVACIRSFAVFFRDFVERAVLDPYDGETNPFHIACYMWWDIFPNWGGSGEAEINEACLSVMSDTLQLSSEVCRISALHGLNHWHLHHAERVQSVIDDFLRDAKGLSPSIANYARAARSGLCQ